MSDESNPGVFPDVYVAAFPNAANRTRISTSGGYCLRWRRDGKELFYLESGKLMAVDVKTGAALEAGVPRMLFGAARVGGVGRSRGLPQLRRRGRRPALPSPDRKGTDERAVVHGRA